MRPQLPLLVLGDEDDPDYTERVIGTGAQGYLCHASTRTELCQAIAVIRDGSIWAPRRVLSRLLEASRIDASSPPAILSFTPRQLQILNSLAAGCSNREIALRLCVGEGTVKSHLARLMRKAGVSNRTELSMSALRNGWIIP